MIGTLLDGRYKLAEHLGKGRLFDVYRAVGEGASQVVVKLLVAEDDRDLLIRLRARVRKALDRSAPGVVPLVAADAILGDRAPRYVVRAFRPEAPLVLEEAMHPEQLAAFALDLAAGIGAVHSWGLVHGGVHPRNLFSAARPSGGRGPIGRGAEEGAWLSDVATSEVGLHPAMDPERSWHLPSEVRGGVRPLQPADDVYAWGAVMFALMTGAPPSGACDRDHLGALERRFQGGGIDVVRRAFHEEPARRFPDGATLAAAVRSDFRVVPVRADDPARPRPPRVVAAAAPAPASSTPPPPAPPAARAAAPAATPASAAPRAGAKPAPAAVPQGSAAKGEVVGGRGSKASREEEAGASKLKGDLARRHALLGSQTHYELLGVKEDASAKEIHETFRSLAKRFHPDRVVAVLGPAERARCERFFESLSEAHEVLSNERSRVSYDLDVKSRATRALHGTALESVGLRDRKAVTQEYLRDASSLASRSDFFGAAQAIRQAILVEPDNVALYMELGRQLAKLPAHHRAAEQALQRVLELDPRQAEAHYVMSVMYREHGMETRAEEQLRRAREIDAKDPRWRVGPEQG